MKSKAQTVQEYLDSLPADRRTAVEAVRSVILKNLDKGYEEGMLYGLIGYFVPHKAFPAGYHCDPTKPVMYAGLASQKNYMVVYLMCCYGSKEVDTWFRAEWAKSEKKLDMGKCCVRFKKIEDVALEAIGKAVARVPMKKYIEQYEATLAGMKSRKPKVKKK